MPADTAIALQAVDAEGRSELNEMSWIYVRPGETPRLRGMPSDAAVHAALRQPPLPMAVGTRPLKLLGRGQPHRFRGNNAAVTGLMEMQFDRYREVASINRHSETAAPLATGADEVAALVSRLKGPDQGLRLSSIQRLGIFRDPAAAPRWPSAWPTQTARSAWRRPWRWLPAARGRRSRRLLAALDDDDPLVRQAAAMALENLSGHARPFDAFGEEDRRGAQAEQWRAWFKSNDWPAIEKALVARLTEGNRDEQRRAAVALGHIGADAARAALAEYVARHREANPYPEWRKLPHSRGDQAKFNALSELNPRIVAGGHALAGVPPGRVERADARRNESAATTIPTQATCSSPRPRSKPWAAWPRPRPRRPCWRQCPNSRITRATRVGTATTGL